VVGFVIGCHEAIITL